MSLFSSLTRQQREAVGLLQIGTVLEYFDLMLYVHMAVLLNELFFPKTDPFTSALLSAFAFCSTFLFRPFGALLFGYIGDRFGRKQTVILTSLMMAVSCVIMATLPTYAEIGIAAALGVTLCRMIQGMSSLGEMVTAQIYLTEISKPPAQYPLVAWIAVSSAIGSMLALAAATFITTYTANWRIVFWVGVSIALFGSVARTRLRETPEFIEAKKIQKGSATPEKTNKKTGLALFLIFCAWPPCIYFSYVYSAKVLQSSFGYTAEQIIQHNFLAAITAVIGGIFWTQLSYKIYPLKIVKFTWWIFLPFLLMLPFLLDHMSSPWHLLAIQATVLTFGPGGTPGDAIYYKYFPVLKRILSVSFAYALARALMYVVMSFGMVFLTEIMGHYGLIVVMLPVTLIYFWGVLFFEKLDKPSLEEGKRQLFEGGGIHFSEKAA
jgi:MFS transporter, MHS family, proline/betaine transporter